MSGDIYSYTDWEGAMGIQWAEAKDATKHSIRHNRALTTKNKEMLLLAKVEKPYSDCSD